MKSVNLIVILFTIIGMNLSAQDHLPGPIVEEAHKTSYQQDGKYLTKRELAEILRSNSASEKEYNKSAKLSKIGGTGTALGIIFLVEGMTATRFSLKAHLDGNDSKASRIMTNSDIALISGLSLLTIGITFGGISVHHLKKSINSYNGTQKQSKIENGIFFFGITGEGVGVGLRF